MTPAELKTAATAAANRNYESGSTPDARLFDKLVEAIERMEATAAEDLVEDQLHVRRMEAERDAVESDWADYFESFDSTVGAPVLTPALAASLMRGPRPWGTMNGATK